MTGTRVTIVDYGAGNLRSVAKAIEKLGRTPHVTGNPDDVSGAEAVIFPGQGASESAMTALRERGLVGPLREVIARGVPFFGVCMGLQLLAGLPRRRVPHLAWAWLRAVCVCCRSR